MNNNPSLLSRSLGWPVLVLVALFCFAIAGLGSAKPLTEKDVLMLLSSGYETGDIIKTLTKQGYEGALDDQTLSKFKSAGATRDMIAALDKFAVRGANSGGAKDDSMVNSLGMKLVPVPGTAVLFCIHPTRKGDYRVFADAIGKIDNSWRNPNDILTDPITRERTQVPVSERDDHPVVSVSWNDAKAFCEWLSKKEGRKYRLPTDHEWSCAVGIGNRDLRDWEPALKDRTDKVPGVFPWGTAWPPPLWAGNFADSQYAAKFPTRVIPADSRSEPAFIRDYHDGFATTSPVGSFAPNALSLYDMAGNVAQWCEDWWDHTHSGRVVRGSSWLSFEEDVLLSAHHDWSAPDNRSNYRGFRIVVEK